MSNKPNQKLNTEYVLRALIREALQSHTVEPFIGDHVVNINPGCKHYGSEGIVIMMNQLPRDMGSVASYKCTNSGDNWSEGDVLEKSLDQLELL
jgi:hypothetical protein